MSRHQFFLSNAEPIDGPGSRPVENGRRVRSHRHQSTSISAVRAAACGGSRKKVLMITFSHWSNMRSQAAQDRVSREKSRKLMAVIGRSDRYPTPSRFRNAVLALLCAQAAPRGYPHAIVKARAFRAGRFRAHHCLSYVICSPPLCQEIHERAMDFTTTNGPSCQGSGDRSRSQQQLLCLFSRARDWCSEGRVLGSVRLGIGTAFLGTKEIVHIRAEVWRSTGWSTFCE